ncbi:MAG: phosphonate ABC transporter substrate-binding protein [Richelia sp. RM2_1_2]|nr:phosphonate ABC transporter substrate-binding protein [Richelia sp. SM1_7_0]NJN08304.1 phosphonate ABC transporter substrate-binding protein [Richelia sp. RM1_1_1]NJO29692.1 phosphonate ABC transporter substrate-binding protein [Richelia sp. SL_2_1]NJO62068.1 phosphonate ABC transporter substrate-binding protein [Richelia sp. RM2_1_2]
MKRRSLIQRVGLFALVLTGTIIFAACNSNNGTQQTLDVKEIKFGIISTESQSNQKPIWEPFIKEMEKQIGIPVKPFYVTQYSGVIEAMATGDVQLAWYGGKSYIEAAKKSNAEAFAQTVNADGTKGYVSHLIVNKDSKIAAEAKALGENKGDEYVIKNSKNLTFAFNEPNSTSGFLVPSFYVFAKNGVNPKEAFKRLIFSGSHEATALAVANNQVDVATNNSESLTRLEETNPEARKKIEVIWTSELIPSDPIAYRKDLPEEVKKKIKDFFYNYKEEKVLKPLGWKEFVSADDAGWNTIRELEIAKKIAEVESNKDLKEEDKKQQIDELKQQLAEINK